MQEVNSRFKAHAFPPKYRYSLEVIYPDITKNIIIKTNILNMKLKHRQRLHMKPFTHDFNQKDQIFQR